VAAITRPRRIHRRAWITARRGILSTLDGAAAYFYGEKQKKQKQKFVRTSQENRTDENT